MLNLHVAVFTLSVNNNIKFLENITQGFERTTLAIIIINSNKNNSNNNNNNNNNNNDNNSNNSDYLIHLTLRNSNSLLALSFKYSDNDAIGNSFHEYYMPLVEINGFNALVDSQPIFDQPVKERKT